MDKKKAFGLAVRFTRIVVFVLGTVFLLESIGSGFGPQTFVPVGLALVADSVLTWVGGERGRRLLVSAGQMAVVWAYAGLVVLAPMIEIASPWRLAVVLLAFVGIALVKPLPATLLWLLSAALLFGQMIGVPLIVLAEGSDAFGAPLPYSAVAIVLAFGSTAALAVYVRRIARSPRGSRHMLVRGGTAVAAIAYALLLSVVIVWSVSNYAIQMQMSAVYDQARLASTFASEMTLQFSDAQMAAGDPSVVKAMTKYAEYLFKPLTLVDRTSGAVVLMIGSNTVPPDSAGFVDPFAPTVASPEQAAIAAEMIRGDEIPSVGESKVPEMFWVPVVQGDGGPMGGRFALVVGAREPGVQWDSRYASATGLSGMMLEGLFPWLLAALLLPVSVALVALERRDAVRAELLFAQERARLSRDAHDRVYNRLMALAGKLEGAGAGDGTVAPADEIRGTVRDLQRILGDVDARVAGARDVGAGLFDDLVTDQSRRWGMLVSLTGQDAVAGLDARLAWELQCVVEEALTNAGRHGHAANATVDASRVGSTLRVEVADDGSGIAVPLGPDGLPHDASGLRGMADRVRTLGGTMTLASGPAGTTVTVEVPV